VLDQLIFVVDKVGIDRIDIRSSKLCRDLVQQLVLQLLVVAVVMAERHDSLIGKVDVPLGELRSVLRCTVVSGLEKSARQHAEMRATGYSDYKTALLIQGFLLALEDVAPQLWDKIIDAWEAQEYGLISRYSVTGHNG
jgi:hypothetical protein